MSYDAHESVGEQTEGPPRGTEAWKEARSGIERVIDVTMTLEEPRTAGQIGDEARFSESPTRRYLELLAELGVVTATTVSGVTKYQPDDAYLRFQEVKGLVERYDRDELMDRVSSMQEHIEQVTEKYAVDDPDELRAKATEDGTSTEKVKEYRMAASEWDTVRHDLDVLKEALERYGEFDRGKVTA